MNALQNVKAFLLSARAGSFSAAARELGLSPSVITKRITQLEDHIGTPLFHRSTRNIALTDAGARILPRCVRIVAELDETLKKAASRSGLEGHLRLKSPTTVGSHLLGDIFAEFNMLHPGLTIELMLMDRSVNPIEEGFDLAIAARSASYPDVVDVPLVAYPCVLCASPAYIEARGAPSHPRELADHDCLTSLLYGYVWTFQSARGELAIEIRPKFSANEGRVLLAAARRGLGLAILPDLIARDDLESGRLVEVLPRFPVATLWLKALVPAMKMNDRAMIALIAFMQERLAAVMSGQRAAGG